MSSVPAKTVQLVKQRDEFCVRCGREAAHTHHRRMRSQSPKAVVHNVENLIRLCTGCHGWVHGHPAESYKHGWLVRGHHDPQVIPVKDFSGSLWFLTVRGTKVRAS